MQYLKVTITDTLGFWDDSLSDYAFNPENSKKFTDWCRIPEDWFQEGALLPDRREAILRHLYRASWRLGNGDGSKYVVLKIEEHRLTDAEAAEPVGCSTSELLFSGFGGSVLECRSHRNVTAQTGVEKIFPSRLC